MRGNGPYSVTVGAFSDNYTPDDPSDDFVTHFSGVGPTVEGFIKPFQDLAREVIAVPIIGHEDGALAVGELADRISEAGLPVCEASGVLDALRQIIAASTGPSARPCCCSSCSSSRPWRLRPPAPGSPRPRPAATWW